MITAKSSQTSDISPLIAAGNSALIITASIRGLHKRFLTLSERFCIKRLDVQILTAAAPRLPPARAAAAPPKTPCFAGTIT